MYPDVGAFALIRPTQTFPERIKIDLHQRKRAVLEGLFKALLHKLMTGEIRAGELELSAIPGP